MPGNGLTFAIRVGREQEDVGVFDLVLEVQEPTLLRYSWQDDRGGEITEVTYRLEPHAGGTRFTYDHTGFSGIGGFAMSRLLGNVRRKMLTVGLPAVLAEVTRTEEPAHEMA